jgi:stalled ribosome rescue protein Dom34
MPHYHAVVWLDHERAVVWQFNLDEQQSTVVHSGQQQHIHSRKSPHGGHRSAPDYEFFDQVAAALSGAHEILIIGPAQAKTEFAQYLKQKHPPLGGAIVAVERADHPSDHQVLDYARRHFTAIDRMQPQPGPGAT